MGKRFTVHIGWFNYEKTEGDVELFDNGQPLLLSECIDDVRYLKDLLNSLNDENEYLKSELKYSKKAHLNCDRLWWELHDEKEQLEKENEELKEGIGSICREIEDKPTMTTTEVMVKLQGLIF